MPEHTLVEVTDAIISSWSPETCYARADFLDRGRVGDRSRGQCGTTALVIQDLLGGDIFVADVLIDGERVGVHYWNQFADGSIVDLTIGQFLDDESVGESTRVTRPPGPPTNGLAPYALLSQRVAKALDGRRNSSFS